jgi:bifunctional UDP-N-acetylglucosamine pyrophosphorylase / glucosamine-1-phosphate N-acetyltransferase
MSDSKAVIILAAGKGKRMKSEIPKVLHEVNGKPIINILLDTLVTLDFSKIIVVVGFKGEMVVKALEDYPVEIAWQKEQLGTGHAVQMTADLMKDFDGTTLVALGDVPYLSSESINSLFDIHSQTGSIATCLSAFFDDPEGYGRIVRDGETNVLKEIVEHKDASDEILKINEINSGTFCFDNKALFEALNEVKNNNAQGEYYLPDTIKIMHDKGLKVTVTAAKNPDEVIGVNSSKELNELTDKFSE